MIKKILVITCILLLTTKANAQKTSWPEITDEIKLRSAQMCYVESEFSVNDCIAEMNVIRKRSTKIGFLEMLFAYSALDANNKRAREISTYPWGDVPGKSTKWNKNWKMLRNLVEDILTGNYTDTCIGATHWGSKTDPRRQYQVKMKCQKKTANVYYKTVK